MRECEHTEEIHTSFWQVPEYLGSPVYRVCQTDGTGPVFCDEDISRMNLDRENRRNKKKNK